MKKQLRIFVSGIVLVIPLAITVYVVFRIATGLNDLGWLPLQAFFGDKSKAPWQAQWAGIGVVVIAIYLIGLLTNFVLFRYFWSGMERLLERLPGIKTVYCSIRDLMKLFGSDHSKKMGRVVEYCPPNQEMGILGILTNEQPIGVREGSPKVAVYLPFAYMIGGAIIFVPKEHLREVDMTVEEAMKLSATAQVGTSVARLHPELSAKEK